MPNRELFALGSATAAKLKLRGETVAVVEATSGGLITASLQAHFALNLFLIFCRSASFNQLNLTPNSAQPTLQCPRGF
jgi:hypothetical protein